GRNSSNASAKSASRHIASSLLERPASGTLGDPASPQMAVLRPPLWLACAPPPAPLIPMCAALPRFPASPWPSLMPSSLRKPLLRSATPLFAAFCWRRLACTASATRILASLPKKPPANFFLVWPFLPDGATKIGSCSHLQFVTIVGPSLARRRVRSP